MAFVMCLFGIFSSIDNYERPNFSLQPNIGHFIIDPKTVIESLDNGRADIFTPNLQGERSNTILFEEPINWKQREYFMITKALNQSVWKDNLDDWELYEMVFFLDCQDNPSGFERSFMTYFKTIPSDSKVYTVRDFSIYPRYLDVEWRGGKNYSRPLFGWKRIDLDNLKIKAEDALRIAEENGGKDIRLKFNNNCRIKLFLEPDIHPEWRIWYSVEGLSKLDLMIDPFTGKIIKNK